MDLTLFGKKVKRGGKILELLLGIPVFQEDDDIVLSIPELYAEQIFGIY